MKEPELYELHARVKQIRRELGHAPDDEEIALEQEIAQMGAATQ